MEGENKTLYVINKEYLLSTLIIVYKSDFDLNLVISSSNGTKIVGFDFLSILKFAIYLCIFNSFNPYIVETLVEKMTRNRSFEYTNQKIYWEISHKFLISEPISPSCKFEVSFSLTPISEYSKFV